MPADEQDLFQQEAIEEAVTQDEQPTREVHPESPELVTPESLAEEPEAEPVEPVAEPAPEETPAEPVAEEPEPAPEPAQPAVPQGYVPIGAVQAERQRAASERARADVAVSRVEELSANFEAVKAWVESQQASARAAEEASAIPSWDKDPIGHLRESLTRGVTGNISPRLEKLEASLGRLDGLLGQTEEQMKARETEQALRQAYTMQEQAAMVDPTANAAINFFHSTRFQHYAGQGYDEATAAQLANEDRFKLYRGGGAQNGPAALVAAYGNLGVNPVQAWQQVQQAAQPEPEVPAATAKVPQPAPQVPQRQQAPPGPRRVDELPPPMRRRRPSESESTAFNYVVHHFHEIPPNELDGHIEKYAQEAGISTKEAYANVMKGMTTRLSA